jgi:PilZ domain
MASQRAIPVVPSARAFVRSLNVLLKFARLYGLDHTRSARQFESAWQELQESVQAAGQTGVVLGTSGSHLLLDGEPIETTPAERSFADLLNTAGVASICFYPEMDREGFASLVKTFTETGLRGNSLTERLEKHFGKDRTSGIRVNEIRFVAQGGEVVEMPLAAQLTASALGADGGRLQDWFGSPEKMIQLIAAAEGIHGGPGGPGAGLGNGGPGEARPLSETDLQNLLRMVAQLGEATQGKDGHRFDAAAWQQQLAALPGNAPATLRQALAAVAAQTPSAKVDEAMLLRLAEHLAIGFALERFQRGEVKVNAVQQMLERMNQELGALRKILKAREEKMANSGIVVESHEDVLDRQFWAAVPESGKRAVLSLPEAWCIPPRNVQQYAEELVARGESQAAGNILVKYAACVRHKDAEARKKAAIGLAQLAGLFSKAGSQPLREGLALAGRQIAAEPEADVQTLLGAAFVRLSQESSVRRCYPAMRQALDSLADLEVVHPSWAHGLRARIGLENRLPECIEEALAAEAMPEGLAGVLVRLPQAAGEHLAARLARAGRRSERERIVEMAQAAGGSCVRHLEEVLRSDSSAKAASVIGLLSRLDPVVLAELLPLGPRQGRRGYQDAVVRQLAIGGAPERGRLLANSMEQFDPMVLPLALDEIGMCGDADTAAKLLQLAEGDILPESSAYVRVKAIDALGRMRAPAAASHLRRFVEARKALGWVYPEEIRTAAAQALMKLDPEWMRGFLPQAGLHADALALAPLDAMPEQDVVRHRRYRRVRLLRQVPAVVASARGKCASTISVLSLDGGLLSGDVQLAVGTEATLKIHAGFRSISVQAVVRSVRSHEVSFETVGMGLDDRAKLRRLLVALGA